VHCYPLHCVSCIAFSGSDVFRPVPGFVYPLASSDRKTRRPVAKIITEHRANCPENKYRALLTLIFKGLEHFC
jgi:hypothetical protein